ncbi:MAG: hypothetical protein HYW33_00830 [Candidatus Blackburnbacteria bacterium]|nr:hypothetical protein [Candidatus Blackburnbacteria bacterium]
MAVFGAIMLGLVALDSLARWGMEQVNRGLNTNAFTQGATAGGLMYQQAAPVVFALGMVCLVVALFWDEIFRYLSGTK